MKELNNKWQKLNLVTFQNIIKAHSKYEYI